MTPLKESFTVAATPDEVWPLIADPALVASCMPGAELTEVGSDGACKGKFTFRFGPTVAVFRGETKLSYDPAARSCTIDARGIDQRGASRARARFEVMLEGSEATVVTLDGGFEVNGPLETFATAGGVHLARVLMGDFAANLARVIEARRAGGEGSTPVPGGGTGVREASGARLLGKAALGWLRGGADKNGKGQS
ncbi:MAG: SRPBCC family protein [Betaproteobacteria bacterium]|nr:SRPBCC family protein [Betaproteobacteria bacterium]